MGLYSRYLFPRLMDSMLSSAEIQNLRKSVLADVQGEVFEIGFGTGLNLPHYPSNVTGITTVDPNAGAKRLAERRIAKSSIPVAHRVLSGERLPFEDESFDSVVSTFTLCSIPKVDQAVHELRRILKPQGRFYFLEHGLSEDPGIQWWQHKLTPLNRRIGDGCHLDRNAGAIIQNNGFRIEHLENFYLTKAPRFSGYIYRGTARKA
jgi:ubiquinone/menaquinone biosynthesis C-methylase UbiE